jgi:DNA uptake protein ComE-like DNA-binding protein
MIQNIEKAAILLKICSNPTTRVVCDLRNTKELFMKMYRLGLWVMAILFSAVLATPSYMMAASKKTSDDSAATDSATPTPKKVSKKAKKDKKEVAHQATPTTEKVSKKTKKGKKEVADQATPTTEKVSKKGKKSKEVVADQATPTTEKVSKKGKKSKEVVADQATPTTEKVSKKAKKASSSSSSAKLVDLNTASMSDLMATGFTSEQATKIASGRPWQRKDQLRAKGILTDSEYQAVSGNIIAKQ